MRQSEMEKEFIEAFRTYGDAIFRFCMVKVSQVELAEDMTQEVFTRYWQSLRDGKEMTNTRSLLYTIANNMAKDWYKRKKATSLDVYIESGHEPKSTDLGPESYAAYAEILRSIDTMDEHDKTALFLTYVEGLPPKDIARILGETPNVISVRLSRATKRLKETLGI